MIKNIYFDKTYCYNRKNLKPKDFANDEWYKNNNQLFVNLFDILDAKTNTNNESTAKLSTILVLVSDKINTIFKD